MNEGLKIKISGTYETLRIVDEYEREPLRR